MESKSNCNCNTALKAEMTAANCEDVRCQASELINRVAADLQYVVDGARLWRLTAGEPSEK